MKPSFFFFLLVGLSVTQLVAITVASAMETDTTPAEAAYYSSLLQRSSPQQQEQHQQQYDDSIERSDRKSDYTGRGIPPATSYSAIIVHNAPERMVKPSDYTTSKGYRAVDSLIGDYHKSRDESVMLRGDTEYPNHMSSGSDALVHGVHPDIMQTLLSQQPQTFDNTGLGNTGYSEQTESDSSWTDKPAEPESDYKDEKYSRKRVNRMRKYRNYKKTYGNDDSKRQQGNFGDREKPLALPSSRLQIQNARPDSIYNVGYSIGIHGSDSMNSDGQPPAKSVSDVHYEGRNTMWKELGSGVEMSVNKRKPKHYVRNDDKESRIVESGGDVSSSLPTSSHAGYFFNDATPDNSNLNAYNSNSNGFDHNHALRHSNSFDFSNAINPKTGQPYSPSGDEMSYHFVPKTELSPLAAPVSTNQLNNANREAQESRINKQTGSIDKEDSRTPRILTTNGNKYSSSVAGQGLAAYQPSAQKFTTNYNLIQPPLKSNGALMYSLPFVLPKPNPLTSIPYVPPPGDFAYQNLPAPLPNALKTPPPGSKPSSTVMAVLVPVNNNHMVLPPLLNAQFDLPYYGFYGNVLPPYAPNRFLAGPALPPGIKPELALQNFYRNHPVTFLDNQDFLLTPPLPKSPPLVHNRKPVEANQDTKHHDLVRYTRGNNNNNQRPRPAPIHFTDGLNLAPYVFNEKSKFASFRPGNPEAQETAPYLFFTGPQQRLPAPPVSVSHNPRDVLSPPPLFGQPSSSVIARS